MRDKILLYTHPDQSQFTSKERVEAEIRAMAEAYYIPVSPHDASGLINVVAGAQVMMTVPNSYRLETSRYDLGKYDQMIETPLDNAGGSLRLSPAPGLGMTMNMDHLRAHAVEEFGG